ncbi:hypothetical protein ACWDXD_25070 [Streptomyces sp. NPDC003314]
MSATLDAITTGAQVGALLPPIIAVVQRRTWSPNQKKVAAVLISLVAGIANVAAHGGWAQFSSGKLTTATILSVVAAAQASYGLFWKPTKVAPTIEAWTTPKALRQAG